MTDEQYTEMVDMLISVTKDKKLSWSELTNGFCTQINGCSLKLITYYDSAIGYSGYTLVLLNQEGKEFCSFDKAEAIDDVEYRHLDLLYQTIRDSILHITESEKNILDGLKELLNQ